MKTNSPLYMYIVLHTLSMSESYNGCGNWWFLTCLSCDIWIPNEWYHSQVRDKATTRPPVCGFIMFYVSDQGARCGYKPGVFTCDWTVLWRHWDPHQPIIEISIYHDLLDSQWMCNLYDIIHIQNVHWLAIIAAFSLTNLMIIMDC